jgi:hypothetical protein
MDCSRMQTACAADQGWVVVAQGDSDASYDYMRESEQSGCDGLSQVGHQSSSDRKSSKSSACRSRSRQCRQLIGCHRRRRVLARLSPVRQMMLLQPSAPPPSRV